MKSVMSSFGELCSGCGACLSVCPHQAINPLIQNGIASISRNDNICTDCNLCIKVCPVFNYAYFEPIEPPRDKIVGKFLKAFICHGTDDRVRWNGASGGVVTALLLFMLKENIIDGALLTKTEGRTYQSYIARTIEDILASQGSTYFPTFSLKHLRELLRASGRNVIVGLPCQIDALKILKKTLPSLEEKIYASFGLVCSHVNEPWYLDYIVRRICKIEPRKVMEITARKGGWPGHIFVRSFDRNENIPYSRFWYPLPLYHFSSPLGCLYCINHLNVNADLSFGDAWLPEIIKSDNLGSSIVIARTNKGLSLLEEAETAGTLYSKEISIDDVLRTQVALEEKSQISIRRTKIRAQLFASANVNYIEVLDALLPIFHATITRNKITRGIIYGLPLSLLRIYCRLCGLIHRKSL